jgi:hypothetical protein
MRRALVLCLAAALAACGGDDNDNPPAPAANVTVSGGADTFTGSNAVGFSTATPLSCSFEGVPTPVSASVLAVFVTDTGGDACALINANQERRGMGGISIVITRGALTGTPAPIGPGNYTIDSTPTVDLQTQTATLVGAFEFKNTPQACGGTSREAESGTVTITSVSGGVISGSINAQIGQVDGGGTITGTFTTAPCAVATPSCDAIIDDSPPICVD